MCGSIRHTRASTPTTACCSEARMTSLRETVDFSAPSNVILARAGIHATSVEAMPGLAWMPASAGMADAACCEPPCRLGQAKRRPNTSRRNLRCVGSSLTLDPTYNSGYAARANSGRAKRGIAYTHLDERNVDLETLSTGFPSPRWGGVRGGVNVQGRRCFFTPTPDSSPRHVQDMPPAWWGMQRALDWTASESGY